MWYLFVSVCNETIYIHSNGNAPPTYNEDAADEGGAATVFVMVEVGAWSSSQVSKWLETELNTIYANESNTRTLVSSILAKFDGFNGAALLGIKNDDSSLKSMFDNDLSKYYNIKAILAKIK